MSWTNVKEFTGLGWEMTTDGQFKPENAGSRQAKTRAAIDGLGLGLCQRPREMNLTQFFILPPRQETGEIMMVTNALRLFIDGPLEMHLPANL